MVIGRGCLPNVIADTIGVREHCPGLWVIDVQFRWWVWGRPLNAKQFLARFYGLVKIEGDTFVSEEVRTANAELITDYQQGAVFVDVVQFMQSPQGVGLGHGWVALVWLGIQEPAEQVGVDGQQDIDESLESLRLLEFLGVIKDGKIDLSSKVLSSGAQHNQVRGDMVQGGTKLVDGVPQNDSPLRRWFRDVGFAYQFLPVRVIADAGGLNGFYVAPSGAPRCGFELIEVRFRAQVQGPVF